MRLQDELAAKNEAIKPLQEKVDGWNHVLTTLSRDKEFVEAARAFEQSPANRSRRHDQVGRSHLIELALMLTTTFTKRRHRTLQTQVPVARTNPSLTARLPVCSRIGRHPRSLAIDRELPGRLTQIDQMSPCRRVRSRF